jgi:hypothetical protein
MDGSLLRYYQNSTGKRYPRSFCLLTSLPLEIYQHVTSFLRPSDVTCLGLTCTGLWLLVTSDNIQGFSRKDSKWREQREKLLQRLARDSLDMVFCDTCEKLQPLHCGRALTMSNNWVKPPCHHFSSQLSICKHFSITREMLELALKFERHAKDGSFPKSDPFVHKCTWPAAGNGSEDISLSVTSKVIGGDTHLKIVYDLDIKLSLKKGFSVPSMRGKGCLHSGAWLKQKCACALRHVLKGEVLCAACSTFQRCAYCFTQFHVSATHISASTLHLQVRAYKYLGRGQDGGISSEHAWASQTRPLHVAKRESIHFFANDCSLEDIFELGFRPNFYTSPAIWGKKMEPRRSFKARIAYHEKYWRPPPWTWN